MSDKTLYAVCRADINGKVFVRECAGISVCEMFYLGLGYQFYANDKITHKEVNGVHYYNLFIFDKESSMKNKSLIEYVRTVAKNANVDLTKKTDREIEYMSLDFMNSNIEEAKLSGMRDVGINDMDRFALAFLGANIEDAVLSGLNA